MLYGVAADLLVVVHLVFVVFVVLGGFAVPRWPRLVWAHLPAVAWGIGIELAGAICPLPPLAQWLRVEAGGAGYEGDFVAHYLLPVLYPAGLTRQAQLVLGGLAGGINVAAYGWWIRRGRAARRGVGRGRAARPGKRRL